MPSQAFALGDDLSGVLDGRDGFGIDRRHELPQRGRLHAVDAAHQAVQAALAIDDHIIAAIAAGETVAALGEGSPECVRAVAGAEGGRNLFLDPSAGNPGAFLLLKLGAGWRPGRTLDPVALVMGALDTIMTEAPFEIARDLLVLPIVVAVADGAHARQIDPRPDDMNVLAAELVMHDDDARVAVEAEFAFEHVDRFAALFVGQPVRRFGADGGVIERLLAVGAGGVGAHLDERAAQILRDGASRLDEAHALVLLGIAEVRRQLLRRCAGFSLDDHGARPSASRMAPRTPTRLASVCCNARGSTPSPTFTRWAI